MTKTPIYQVDAFTDHVFAGNPAAICPLDTWLPDDVMQAVAAENNLAETAFFVANGDAFDLRWFTPAAEVDLCGHATLASAHVLLNVIGTQDDEVRFDTRSGRLTVRRAGNGLEMDFPATPPEACDPLDAVVRAIGRTPVYCGRSANVLAIVETEDEVRDLKPDLAAVAELHPACLIVSAPGEKVDFVSRFFAPTYGIDEDPVTGSAHCTLVPYWADRLGKKALSARQISARGGDLVCEDRGDRVAISGQAVLYLTGEIEV